MTTNYITAEAQEALDAAADRLQIEQEREMRRRNEAFDMDHGPDFDDDADDLDELVACCNDLGWHVDNGGQIWWPNDDAQAEISASDDPAEAVVEMCKADPMRGEWHC